MNSIEKAMQKHFQLPDESEHLVSHNKEEVVDELDGDDEGPTAPVKNPDQDRHDHGRGENADGGVTHFFGLPLRRLWPVFPSGPASA